MPILGHVLYLLWFVSRALVAAEAEGKLESDRVLVVFVVLWLSWLPPTGPWWTPERARAMSGGIPGFT